jgi:ubiquinone/menaquinone biosynthesis C-methylase UbiE
VLELGFGPGHLQLALHEKGIASFGLDESPQMTVQATRRLGHRGYQPRLTRGIAQHLPFASARFNTVVATFPSEYITTPETIAEIYRVLIPNGRLVILAHATFAGNNFSERIAGWLFRITGQAADTARQIVIFEKLLFPFREAGFDLDFAERKVRGSTLFFVSARKQIAVSAQPTLR